MRLLRAGDHIVMPWKNGAGATTQIAIAPPGASLDGFDWRVSMAGVVEDGPFSTFPGIDRTLAVLEGEGIVLEVEGAPPRRLTGEGEPAVFPGDVPTRAALIGGPITDLNVMSRRSRYAHRLARRIVDAPVTLAPSSGIMLVLALSPGLRVGGERLERLDAAMLDAPTHVEADHATICYVIELWEVADGHGN
ncbi:HutD/Ves family protein [Ancylobacter mangrovi]|uniref:HutD/Ves family protein n=1 Tax=Ancylobacter mangrovi TaxID=2972472 RepID=UPI002162951D|nr:HutD family protein [Ancylobacter mangrovi]MCS0504509.1 HutD family protein [Ancylobacter mangrovi]